MLLPRGLKGDYFGKVWINFEFSSNGRGGILFGSGLLFRAMKYTAKQWALVFAF